MKKIITVVNGGDKNSAAKKRAAELTLPPKPAVPTELGKGLLPLVIVGIRELTPRVRAYELRDPHGKELPFLFAGSHLQVPVLLSDGKIELRHYSICSNPADRDFYEIAVLKDASGRGGSLSIHDNYTVGLRLNCEPPVNQFQLHADNSPAILIAGGIGITPIKPMVQVLVARGRRVQLHYAGRSLKEMAFSECLSHELGANFFAYPADENKRFDVMQVVADAPHNALFYVCGPLTLIDAVYTSATLFGVAKDRIQCEQFSSASSTNDGPLFVELVKSKKLIYVAQDQSILTALRDAGISVNFDCCVGDCGTCTVKVLDGEVDHRDQVLSDLDRAEGMMCVCVSRAKSERLVVDL